MIASWHEEQEPRRSTMIPALVAIALVVYGAVAVEVMAVVVR